MGAVLLKMLKPGILPTPSCTLLAAVSDLAGRLRTVAAAAQLAFAPGYMALLYAQ